MILSTDMIERLPRVEGLLNYLAPMPEKPMNLTYDPPPGVPRSMLGLSRIASRSTVKAWLLLSIAARSRTSMTRTSCAVSIIRKPNG